MKHTVDYFRQKMDVERIGSQIEKLGFKPSWFSVGEVTDELFCLTLTEDKYEVFYCSKGNMLRHKEFYNQSAATKYLVHLMESNSTIKAIRDNENT